MTKSVSQNKVFVIGLVGGIASGKSNVAAMFGSLGAAVIDADQLGHDVLLQPEVAKKLAERFGDFVLDEAGNIDRNALAKLVFGDNAESARRLKQLEEVLHPLIFAEATCQLKRWLVQLPSPTAIIIDAPLLLEAGWASLCDLVLFVDTPDPIRLQRAKQRGWTSEHFAFREQHQMSLDSKRRAATHIIDGTADQSLLRATLNRLLQEMHHHS